MLHKLLGHTLEAYVCKVHSIYGALVVRAARRFLQIASGWLTAARGAALYCLCNLRAYSASGEIYEFDILKSLFAEFKVEGVP